jgi:hypothetical protein
MGYNPFDGITIVLCEVTVNNMSEMCVRCARNESCHGCSSGIATRSAIASSDVPMGVARKSCRFSQCVHYFTVLEDARIELISPTDKSCEFCLLRRWTKPLRGGGESPVPSTRFRQSSRCLSLRARSLQSCLRCSVPTRSCD